MMETTTMTEVEEDCQLLLPDEITSEILSRLPAGSVMKCKCVCKTWRALIADPVFIDLYHQKTVVEWATLCNKRTIECHLNVHLHFGEYNDNIINDDDYGNKKKIINPFKHSQPVIYRSTTAACHLPGKLNAVCSCNGLIFSMSMLANNMFVCNPLTREYVDLPLPLGFKSGFRSNFLRGEIILASGFGYNSYTNEYKIVVIYKHRHACSPGYVTIYTLGSRRWRDKGEISPKLIDGTNLGVFFNGALHWLTEKKEIVSFDLADELFRIVPSPPSSPSQSDHVPQLGLLGGCLCVTRKRSTTLDIWVMDNELQSWTRKFNIAWKLGGNLCADGYRPLALSKSGKLILFSNYFGKPLVSYDPETETSIVDDSFPDFTEIYVLRYIKSYVSLKELGEINADQIYDDGEKWMICESSYSDLMEFEEE